MPEISVDQEIDLDPKQLAIITGIPSKKLATDFEFPWGNGKFKVGSISDCKCTIVRLAGLQEENTKPFSNPERFDALDFFVAPKKVVVKDFGMNPKVPVPLGIVPEPHQTPSGDTVTKDEMPGGGGEPKMPHVHIMHSPQGPWLPRDRMPSLSGASRDHEVRQTLNRMLAFDKQEQRGKLDPAVEAEMVRVLLG